MKGIGAYKQGQAQGEQLDFNAQQMRLDAGISVSNAESQAKSLRQYGRRLKGTQRTRFAKSNIRINGTALEVMAESAENIELDAIGIRQQGIFKGKQLNMQADFQEELADQARLAGTIGAISSIVGGGASAGSMFM